MSKYVIKRDLTRGAANLLVSLLLFAVAVGFARPVAANDGDVNQNGETNLGDLVLLYQFVSGIRTPTSQEQTHGDVNQDGGLSVADILLLQRQLMGFPDVLSPTVPANVSAVALNPLQVDVSWDASIDSGGGVVAGYNVYREDVGLVGTATGATSFSDTSVAADATYNYTVSAFDDATPANESAQSSPAANVTTPRSTGLEIRVNAGDGQYTDTAGKLWLADTGFNTGLISSAGVGNDIIGTEDDALYQRQRFDDTPAPELTYSFTVPNGDYTVNLLFAENYSGAFAIGARVFSVNMEGATVISDLDIYATVGSFTPLVQSVPVTVNDGQLNIQFIHQVENPIVAAIEILSLSPVLPINYDFTGGNTSAWSAPVNDSGITSDWQGVGDAYLQNADVGSQSLGTPFDQSYKLGTYTFVTSLTALTDYSASVDITPLRDVPARDPFDGQDVGLMFRYRDSGNYYRVSFSARESFARLEKKVGNVFTTLATNARGYVEEQTYNVALNLEGGLIQVTLDGDPLFAVYDTDLPNGSLALYAQDAASFDNVVVDVPDPNPTLVLGAPLAHSVQTGNAVTATAAITNFPSGGSVEFEFGGTPCAAPVESPAGSGFYTADCGTPVQGDYFLAGQGLRGLLRNSGGGVVASDENLRVGIQGDSFVTVGDSNTLGTYDFFAADNLSTDGRLIGQQGYQATFNNKATTSTGRATITFNQGVGGDETVDTLLRIDSIMERYPGVDGAFLMLGTNDASSGSPILPAQYQANMQSLVDTMTGPPNNKTVWVAKSPPALPYASNTTRNNTVKGYNTAIDSLTGIQAGPNLFDFYYDDNGNGVGSDDYERLSLFHNSLHPNALGRRIEGVLWNNAVNGAIDVPFYLDRLCNRMVSATCTAVSPTNHKQNLRETGYPYYVDETFTLTSIPAALADGIWILTANMAAERDNTAENYIQFTVDRPVTVYIAYDGDAGVVLPDWLDPASSSYTDTGLDIQTTNPASPTLNVYSQAFAAGPVSLGGNMHTGASGADANYIVVVVEQ